MNISFNEYVFNILKAVHSIPIKDSYISDYVAMRIFYILSQDYLLKDYFSGDKVDIPDFCKREFSNN